ncbi:MAG: DEAD/DEAH box helicase [Kiritimatiellae bacterium]|nr:DEAD/DEAH box helicase [Kiritimatiellia bacterium]
MSVTKTDQKRLLTYVIEAAGGLGVTCSVFADSRDAHYGLHGSYPCDPRRLLASSDVLTLSPQHRRILMRLVMCQASYSVEIALRGPEGVAIVREMVATGHCFWSSQQRGPLRWGPEREATAMWRTEANGLFHPVWLVPPPAPDRILPLTPPLYLDLNSATCGLLQTNLPDALAATWTATAPMDARAGARFCHDVARWFPEVDVPLPDRVPVQTLADILPVPCLTISEKEFGAPAQAGSRATRLLVLRLEFDYAGKRVAQSARGPYVSLLGDDGLRRVRRHRDIEERAVERLRTYGFCPLQEALPDHALGASEQNWLLSRDRGYDWAGILSAVLPQLEKDGWRVDRKAGLNVVAVNDDDWYTELESTGIDWFEFEAGVRIEGRRINVLPVVQELLAAYRGKSLQEIEAQLAQRTLTVSVAEGTVLVVSGARLFPILRNLFELFHKEPLQRNGRLRMDFWRVAEIAELEKIFASAWNAPGQVRTLARRLQKAAALAPRPAPAGFEGGLRPYQEMGLAWLQFLQANAFDGILADDMGLGKTVQALAHFLIEKQNGRLDKPVLIVAPTSVTHNWMDEIRRFTPPLSALLLHGPDRKADFAKIDQVDLVVTSYALLRRDADVHRKRDYSYIVLDEAQFIKNHRALTAHIVRNLSGRRRLCLTGTPMENHLGEMWSLFHFLMPGFLGTQQGFNTQFRSPVEKDGDPNLRLVLKKRVAPFLLRRTKQEVEQELPPKTEIVHTVELSDRQRELYETIRLAMESRIRREITRKGFARSQITILQALLRLRQTCCDPRLADKQAKHFALPQSCKLAALLDMIPEMIEEGRHILLFSQFTRMLALIEQELDKRGIRYVTLTGSTRDRQALVRRFQSGEVPLFLISLKAGGTGLNLTAADTVIHYDPWWNPAVERQATDRAHRIGQYKPVFVYKLLTTGTVEAKILELQNRKRVLVAGVLTEQAARKLHFDQKDLERLLAPVA